MILRYEQNSESQLGFEGAVTPSGAYMLSNALT